MDEVRLFATFCVNKLRERFMKNDYKWAKYKYVLCNERWTNAVEMDCEPYIEIYLFSFCVSVLLKSIELNETKFFILICLFWTCFIKCSQRQSQSQRQRQRDFIYLVS